MWGCRRQHGVTWETFGLSGVHRAQASGEVGQLLLQRWPSPNKHRKA